MQTLHYEVLGLDQQTFSLEADLEAEDAVIREINLPLFTFIHLYFGRVGGYKS